MKIKNIIIDVARSIVPTRAGWQVLIPSIDVFGDKKKLYEDFIFFNGMRVSCTTSDSSLSKYYNYEEPSNFFSVVCDPSRSHDVLVTDGFQFAFGAYTEVSNSVSFREQLTDPLCHYVCSKSNSNTERVASNHMLGLEQMLKSVKPGSFFAAVVPSSLGMSSRYSRWWENNAYLVAKIALPRNIFVDDEGNEWEDNGDVAYSLMVWMKPMSQESANSVGLGKAAIYASHRHPAFITRLLKLDAEHIASMADDFRDNDWWEIGVSKHMEMLEQYKHSEAVRVVSVKPVKLPDPDDKFVFGSSNIRNDIEIVDSIDKIKRMKRVAHIKMSGGTIGESFYSPLACGMSAVIDKSEGFTFDEATGNYVSNFRRRVGRMDFGDARAEIISSVKSVGLEPVMTKQQARMIQKAENRYALRMTPFSRQVQVDDGFGGKAWETINSDCDLKAAYPIVYKMWRDRLVKMRMHEEILTVNGVKQSLLFDFQQEDAVDMAARGSTLLANKMGLGKTRLSLATAMLLSLIHISEPTRPY